MAEYPNLRDIKKSETKEAIYRAAVELFATRGYSRTTVGMIARKAHISPRTLFGYYPAKKEILFSVPSGYCSSLINQLRSPRRPKPTFQVYKEFLYAIVEDRPPAYYLELDQYFYSIVYKSTELGDYIDAMKDRLSDALAYSFAQDMQCAIDDFPARFAGDMVAHSLWTAAPLLFPSKNYTKQNLDEYFKLLEQTLVKLLPQIKK